MKNINRYFGVDRDTNTSSPGLISAYIKKNTSLPTLLNFILKIG